jgi:transposase
MQKRHITLEAAERATLEAGRHHHPQHQFRARCQGLLWSADGQPVPALAALLHVSQGTVYSWFNRWEQGGLAGLANAKGQGRPAILQAADRERVEAAVRANRQQLKEVTAALRQELAKSFSPLTLKRFLKSVGANGGASATA